MTTKTQQQQKQQSYKALAPRIHEVQNKGNKSSKIYTDYDQRLWPVPLKVQGHGTG